MVMEWKKLRKINRLYLTLKDNISQNWNQYLEIFLKVTFVWQRDLYLDHLLLTMGVKDEIEWNLLIPFSGEQGVYYLCNILLQVVR